MDAAILVRNVDFSYEGFSLRDVSLTLAQGEQKALVGLNGSGKTTLMRLILGLLAPESGEIRVLGLPVTEDNLWRIRQQTGYLFQNPADQLFAPTVWEDVAFGPRNQGLDEDEIRARVQWALDLVGMTEYRSHPVNELSHGQAKRVALAGLIAMRPKILLLDEPFTGLDFPMIKSMVEIVDELRDGGVSVMFTTHNRFFVENWADSVVVMHEGRVVFDGNVDEALNDDRIITLMGDWDCLRRGVRKIECFSKTRRYG
ncbi:MAG: energy-coupling factor ABC transporter ATP-binding protein [Candidatus Thorarchaeota archaeon]